MCFLMTASVVQVPRELFDQLAEGGRVVFPLGQVDQRLYLVERTEQGFVESALEGVRFVPLMSGTIRS